MFECWKSLFIQVLDKHAPLKTKRVRKKGSVPWINKDIKAKLFERDFLKRNAIKTNEASDWNRYKSSRNAELGTSLLELPCVMQKGNTIYNEYFPAWWKKVKKLSGMNVIGGTSDEIVKTLRPGDDTSSSDKRDLANEINNAPMARYAPLSSVPRQHFIQPAQSDTVITVTSNAVFQNLLKLNPKKAHGPVAYRRGS